MPEGASSLLVNAAGVGGAGGRGRGPGPLGTPGVFLHHSITFAAYLRENSPVSLQIIRCHHKVSEVSNSMRHRKRYVIGHKGHASSGSPLRCI